MSVPSLFRGIVNRFLPAPQLEGNEDSARLNRYGEVMCETAVLKQYGLAEEGSYFTVNNGQSGLATAATPTAFSATNPFLLVFNTDSTSSPSAKSIFLDYAMLLATAAGTAGASLQFAVTMDFGNRYASGGSEITSSIVSPSALAATHASVARVFAGNITASAATTQARTVVGNRYLKGAIPVAGDEYTINFGPVEMFNNISISTISKVVENSPPVIVAPGWSALIHLWLPSQSAASSYAPELSWYER